MAHINMKVMTGRVSFYGVRDSSRQENMSLPTAIVSATAAVHSVCHWCLALQGCVRTENVCLISYMTMAALPFPKNGSHCGGVSDMRFNSLKSSRDSSRQYSLKKMHPSQLSLGHVSIATGGRSSATNKNERLKGFRPQLT